MDVLDIDISKKTFDVALLLDKRVRQTAFSNTEAGFVDLLRWLAKHRPLRDAPLHACMEATGNYGLDLAEMLRDRVPLRGVGAVFLGRVGCRVRLPAMAC